jgi:hypothetical protein
MSLEVHMSLLKQLKFSAAPVRGTPDPKIHRRARFIEHLEEQLAMADASLKGEHYTKTRQKWMTDEAGNKTLVTRPKRMKAWWTQDPLGAVTLVIRYGNKPFEIEKGKAAVEVGAKEKLPDVLKTLIEATRGGELDDLLASGAKTRAAAFKPKRAS